MDNKAEKVFDTLKNGGRIPSFILAPGEGAVVFKQGGYEVLPAGMKEIPDGAYKDNEMVTAVLCPAGLKRVGNRAFEGGSSLEIFIPSPVLESVGFCAFAGCGALTEFCQPGTLSHIGNYAFESCVSLRSFTLRAGAEYGDCMLIRCAGLQELVVEEGVTELPVGLCMADTLLRRVDFPSSLRVIRAQAFSGTGLTEVTLPKEMDLLDCDVFARCSFLGFLKMPERLGKCLGGIVSECPSLTSVTLPGDMRELPEYFFMDCTALKSFTVPEGIVSIGRTAFGGCRSLESCRLPSTLKEIHVSAFFGCGELRDLNLPETIEYVALGAFTGCDKLPIFV